ncbi:TPA: hypothetical protein OMS29_004235 [Klebsiella aerogenes]|nr:hypothetical protein [Klebsiella aerogenes]
MDVLAERRRALAFFSSRSRLATDSRIYNASALLAFNQSMLFVNGDSPVFASLLDVVFPVGYVRIQQFLFVTFRLHQQHNVIFWIITHNNIPIKNLPKQVVLVGIIVGGYL